MLENPRIVPTSGYLLPLWENKGTYRATALAYMQQENVNSIEHYSGEWYSLLEIQNAVIGFKI
jgi:hypothetical protein